MNVRDPRLLPHAWRGEPADAVPVVLCTELKDHGKIAVNPCERVEQESSSSSKEPGTPEFMAAYNAAAQDGVRLRQSKTGELIEIPVVGTLRVVLDAAVEQNPNRRLILNNSHGRPWTEGGFRSSFFKLRDAIGLKGRSFHDPRGTAVTRPGNRQNAVAKLARLAETRTNSVK